MNKSTLFILSLLLLPPSLASAAEVAGKIGYMSGSLIAKRADGTITVLKSKSEVMAGDTLETSKGSFAQVLMNDGSKMTLRPQSNLKIEDYKFSKEKPAEDNAVFRLLRGGFRTASGLIGKRGNPDAYKLKAATATIGIRGTDFSTRLCNKDCAEESGASSQAAAPVVNPVPTVGRAMLVRGEVTATDSAGKLRKLAIGSPVYEGDLLVSAAQAYAVVAFRDESRVSLQENTTFQVETFKYDKLAAQESAVMKLLRGGVRVVTGLIGRTNHDNFKFKVSTATVGIRGTGFDAWCNGPCASAASTSDATQGNPLNGAGVYVWSGEVVLVAPGGSYVVAIQQAAIIARESGKPVGVVAIPPSIINNDTPRPDSIPFDREKLFGGEANAGDSGLYVTVHDGQVVLTQDKNTLDLGKGESGFTTEEVLTRLATAPAFMSNDAQPDTQENGTGGKSGTSPPSSGCVVR